MARGGPTEVGYNGEVASATTIGGHGTGGARVTSPDGAGRQFLRMRVVSSVFDEQSQSAHGQELTDATAEQLAFNELVVRLESERSAHDLPAARRVIWLLHLAVVGCMPTREEMLDSEILLGSVGSWAVYQRLVEVADEREAIDAADLELVRGVVLDVSIAARTSSHAGIPRVVRSVARRWVEQHDATLVVWDGGAFRHVSDVECGRLGVPKSCSGPSHVMVVPYDATVVAVEVLRPDLHAQAVGAAADVGVIDLVGIAYDLAALTVPTSTTDATTGPFLHYLQTIGSARRISAISETTAADFSDYFRSFARMGRPVPEIRSRLLPSQSPALSEADVQRGAAALDTGWGSLPLVLCVSSIQPRKNQLRLLAAAETLWAEDNAFQLVFVEGTGQAWPAFDRVLAHLQSRGRPVRIASGLPDETLWAAYRTARFSVSVSLVEGFGLPVAESLVAGTPVILTTYGASAELAVGGGTVPVDPRDVDGIADAMRRLLRDDEHHRQLAREAAAREWTTWDDYAGALWSWLVDGVEPAAVDGART
jgi:glycosyltransferase involved in cell wall biosynthesis